MTHSPNDQAARAAAARGLVAMGRCGNGCMTLCSNQKCLTWRTVNAAIDAYLVALPPAREPEDGQLLPCPFCGGKAEIVNIDSGENTGGSCVCCTKCNASSNVDFDFKENFVSNWNRRATLPPANVEAEREGWQPMETAPRAHMDCEMKGIYEDIDGHGFFAFRATHWRARSQTVDK